MTIRRKFDWDAMNEKISALDKKPQYGGGVEEENFYKPKTDEHGNANVLIRFMPPPLNEDLPFIKKYNHGFQSVNGWFIEDCPTTIGEPCAVCKYNGSIWGSDEATARNQKRKVNFYANILIVKDPLSPENEGKVFKFRYGVKLHERLMEKTNPESDIDEAVPIFDYERGANFKLKVKTQKIVLGGKERAVPNYDASSFSESSPVALNGKPLTDAELEELDKKIYPLQPLIAKKLFKSYDVLAGLFFKKTGVRIPTSPDEVASTPAKETDSARPATKASFKDYDDEDAPPARPAPRAAPAPVEDENDDEFFKKLREQQ
jgi:hypothetical protein